MDGNRDTITTRPRARLRRLAFVFALSGPASILPLPLATAAPVAGDTAVIEATRRPDVVVVTYREVLGEIGDVDRGPVLRIYGDGRMAAHYPHYMRHAGDYVQRLAPGELDQLLHSLAAKGLLDFDAAAARAATRASTATARQRALAANTPVSVFEAVDAATTVIEVTLDRYRATTPGAREIRNRTTRATWTGLRTDAQRHPDVSAIRDLAAAEHELRTLRERPGFMPVP